MKLRSLTIVPSVTSSCINHLFFREICTVVEMGTGTIKYKGRVHSSEEKAVVMQLSR